MTTNRMNDLFETVLYPTVDKINWEEDLSTYEDLDDEETEESIEAQKELDEESEDNVISDPPGIGIFETDLPDLKNSYIKKADIEYTREHNLEPKSGNWEKPERWIKPETSFEDESELPDVIGVQDIELDIEDSPFYIKPGLIREADEMLRRTIYTPGLKISELNKLDKTISDLSGFLHPIMIEGLTNLRINKLEKGVAGEYTKTSTKSFISISPNNIRAPTLLHELGHNFFFNWFNLNVSISNNRLLRSYYSKALESDSGFPSRYSRENFREFFAECFSAYLLYNSRFRKRNKNVADFFDGTFKEAGLIKALKNNTVVDS